MPFCTSCGKENPVDAKFCALCGKELIASLANCSKCGKVLEENEKFCSACGTPVGKEVEKEVQIPVRSKSKPKENEQTPEGRKIIKASTKPSAGKKQAPTSKLKSTPPKRPPKKKERGPVGCFFRTLFILISIVLGFALIIVVVNVFFIEDNGFSGNSSQKDVTEKADGLADTDIPGIVDIEPGAENYTANPDKNISRNLPNNAIKESSDVKELSKMVEVAFAKADTTLLKQLLTETSLEKYKGVFQEIEPYMAEYAKAFKTRKLIRSNQIFSLYSFEDDEGNIFTAEFTSTGNGNWKLARF